MDVCVGVPVGTGVDVAVSVGMGVNVLEAGMPVDVESGAGEEVEAGGCSAPHAEMASINVRKRDVRILCFMPPIVPNSALNSSPRPEGVRSGRTVYILARCPFFFKSTFLKISSLLCICHYLGFDAKTQK